MFDTHCHLDKLFDPSKSFNSVLKSTASTIPLTINVSDHFYLTVSTSISDWQAVLDISSHFEQVYAALGLHPWFVTKESLTTLDKLYNLVRSNVVHAIGEIGLDFSNEYKDNAENQINAFTRQLALAKQSDLPVSMHLVKSHNQALQELKKIPVKGVVHGLGTSVEMAQHYVDLGLKIGVNGVVVRENAVRYHQLVKYFGLEHIVLETDYPNVKLPGLVTTNLSDINTIANTVATLLNSNTNDVIMSTDHNAKQIFNPG
ncbi:MAG: TatD family hydrolase [Pseudomonadota bacterium]|nr:TatD family hydrolase [Pseudomonadota bacterium]